MPGCVHEDAERPPFNGVRVHPLRILGAALAVSALLAVAPPPPIAGFTAAGSAQERVDEARFLDIPSAQGALDDATRIQAQPHAAGSPGDRALAEWTRDVLQSYGWDARLEAFTGRIDTPKRLALELYPTGAQYVPRTGARRARGTPPIGLDLRERGDPNDPPTEDPAVGLPFNAGSPDGDVIGPLVYANHGVEADYATLRAAHVGVRGAVLLVRYGAALRGELAKRAQDAGAKGIVLYDDPADDPSRPRASVQRGDVGDGIRIPTLPISAENARTLLASLRGAAGPAGWSGALDAPYPVAKGPGIVHLVVQLTRTTTTMWNTVATLAGTEPDERIVLGGHRDAWVYGVVDNGSGITTLLEAARGIGYLAQSGRRPRRTIVVALWDGEEFGLYGSEAYVRAHPRELRNAVAYLNADENITGTRLAASASAALRDAIVAATAVVPDPARAVTTLQARWRSQRGGIEVRPPIGGSDHEPFLALGTPVVADLGFEGRFGTYHSSYDTLRYAERVSDPGFVLHRTAAQLYGILALRLANAATPPYGFGSYVPTLRSGIAQLQARAQRDRRVVELAPLRGAIDAFAAAAARADDATARGAGAPSARAVAAARDLDAVAYGTTGYRSVLYPRIVTAYESGDPRALADEIARARDAIDRAAAVLR